MSSSTDSTSSKICGPWKLFRIVFRLILFSALAWNLLALLWAFLPSPLVEHDGDNGIDYATNVFRSGKTLTRVYDSHPFRVPRNDRLGFALDYKLDTENLSIDIGWIHGLPIIVDRYGLEGYGKFTKKVKVYARIGDTDGANLPWFTFADSVLLYSWVQDEAMNFEVAVQWSVENNGLGKMEVYIAVPDAAEDDEDYDEEAASDNDISGLKSGHSDKSRLGPLLLTVEIKGKDRSTIAVTVPEMPLSSSPSKTYSIRLAIIHVIAPTAVFVNNLLGNAFGDLVESTLEALLVVFIIVLYVFMTFAVVFSLWRCLKGPSFEETVERIHARLQRLSQNERLPFLKTESLREDLDLLCQNQRFRAVVNICRNGWHPERDSTRAAEDEAADTEKGLYVADDEGLKSEDTSSKQ